VLPPKAFSCNRWSALPFSRGTITYLMQTYDLPHLTTRLAEDGEDATDEEELNEGLGDELEDDEGLEEGDDEEL